MQVEFVTSVSERLLGSTCFIFGEVIHRFSLRFAMVPNCVPSATRGCYLIFSPLINIWDCSHLKLIKLHTYQEHALGHGFSIIHK